MCNKEKVKDTNPLALIACLILGHKPVEGRFTDGKFFWGVKCSRCGAVKGIPQIETSAK